MLTAWLTVCRKATLFTAVVVVLVKSRNSDLWLLKWQCYQIVYSDCKTCKSSQTYMQCTWSYSQANSVFRCSISTVLKLSLTCSARHSLMSVLVLVDLTLWLVCYNCDECTHVPPFDNICSVMIDWRTSTLTLSITRTLSQLLHAVGLLCTRVTVTMAVYFERVCVYVFVQ